jgi:hypothetical protein
VGLQLDFRFLCKAPLILDFFAARVSIHILLASSLWNLTTGQTRQALINR